jgi:hypothetical protein
VATVLGQSNVAGAQIRTPLALDWVSWLSGSIAETWTLLGEAIEIGRAIEGAPPSRQGDLGRAWWADQAIR